MQGHRVRVTRHSTIDDFILKVLDPRNQYTKYEQLVCAVDQKLQARLKFMDIQTNRQTYRPRKNIMSPDPSI